MTCKHNVFLLLCISFICAQEAPVVNTTQGLISGLVGDDGDYYMYLGIPYAVVDPGNPFGPSLPPPAFEGIFNATDDSAICPQLDNGVLLGSLDCLHMNVFVPSTGNSQNKLPVLIFLHGGAFIHGFYGRYLYGAKFLTRHDIILITLNYRLGPYGFMCTNNPRVPGNQALKDQLMALRWIHNNIENFGGDQNKVTLSGNSAGAMTSDMHIIRNSDEKLFQQVILQSGVSFFPSYPPTVWNSPLILAEHFGFSTHDVDEALDGLARIELSRILIAGFQLGIHFRPCIERSFDGVEPFMTENWVQKDVIQTAKNLNIIIGFNENEALGLLLFPSSDLSNVVNEGLRETYAIDHEDFTGSENVRHFFFGDEELDASKFKEAIDLRSDMSFVYTSMRSLNRYLKSEVGRLYLYLFSYDGERNLAKMRLNTTVEGAVHADEVGYLYDVSYFGEPTVDDQITIDRMTVMWANFVKYGFSNQCGYHDRQLFRLRPEADLRKCEAGRNDERTALKILKKASRRSRNNLLIVISITHPTPELTELVPVKWQAITPTSPHHYMHIGSELEAGTSPYNDRIAFWDLFHETNKHLQNFVLDNASEL